MLRLEVPCTHDAPCVVREALDQVSGIESIRDDARLVATELVTNAVLHSGCAEHDLIEVCAELAADRLIISVDDPGIRGDTAAVRFEEDPSRGGFGLRLVEQISRRWGSEHPNGHRVWAELPLRG